MVCTTIVLLSALFPPSLESYFTIFRRAWLQIFRCREFKDNRQVVEHGLAIDFGEPARATS